MKIKFYNKSFAAMPPDTKVDWRVDRYSHHILGGPKSATISAPATVDKWDATKLLRCPVEVMNEDGQVVWWGMVNKITIPHEEKQVGLSLTTMVNRANVQYTEVNENTTVAGVSTTTGWADEPISQTEFGTRERLISSKAQNSAQAIALRTTQLNLFSKPTPTLEMGTGDRVILECVGWWETLDWEYYQNTTASLVETTTQASAIITACGQFLVQTLILNASGVQTNQARDENLRTGLAEIEAILKTGDSSGRMMMATVTKDRSVHIAKIPDEAVQYYLLPNGGLQYPWGGIVPDSYCKVGVWVALRNMPAVIGGMLQVKSFFVESAEYNVASESTRYNVLGTEDVLNLTALR